MLQRPILILIVSFLSCIGNAAGGAETVPLYGRFDQAFEVAAGERGELAVEFKSPSGETVVRPTFHDGGDRQRVRFMPLEEGRWAYRVRPGGGSGSFDVKKVEDGGRFLEHGPVRVSKDGTHLEHLDGTPFFFLADTVWNGPLLSKKDDWGVFLRDRTGKHFSAIQFNMLAPWRTAPTNAEGLVAYTGTKDVRINPEFYKRIDERMAQIEDAGLLSVPVLLWAWGKNDAGQALPEADAVKVIRYQLARYGAHPVVWILNGDGNYRGEVAERWKRIGRAVFKEKLEGRTKLEHHAPVTLHPGGLMWPYDEFREEKWLDIYGYQSSHSVGPDTVKWIHSGPAAQGWKGKPARPYINLEPCYEAHLSGRTTMITDTHVRNACWWSMLAAPAAGLTYGGHGIWSWQELDGLPYDHPYTGMAKRWQEAKDLPGATQMKHLADFFTSIRWWTLKPAQDVLETQPGGADPLRFVAVAKTADGSTVVAYMPAGGDVTFKRDATNGKRAEWYDPRTGRRTDAEGDRGAYRAPDEKDWVLLLK